MKNAVPIFLGIMLGILGVIFYVIKSGDNTQITNLNASLEDASNRMDIVNAKVTERDAQLVTLSNNLVTASAAVTDVSNQLTTAQIAVEEQKQQVGNVNTQWRSPRGQVRL